MAALTVAVMLTVASPAAAISPVLAGAHAQPQVLLVRDGCGRGLRYSERRDACVEDFDGPPPYDRGPPRDYDRRPPPPPPVYDRRPPPPAMYDRGDYRGEPRGPDCGPGLRFSNSRQACVRIEGAVEERGNTDVAAGALIGGAVGALIGSSIRDDAGRR